MLFEVSTAKKEILEKLAEQPWTPTDLAEELDTSRSSVYNHLDALHEQGILTKQTVPAKTRPRTEYSIGRGFMQYLAVLPGQYSEKSIELTPEKQATLRIWGIPQEEFQPYVERYWWSTKNSVDFDYREDITAVAVYGSVARGDADENSDIDFLVITENGEVADIVSENMGSLMIGRGNNSKIGMTEVYSETEYRNSLVHGSDFLENIQDEIHVIYDPSNVLRKPDTVLNNEQ